MVLDNLFKKNERAERIRAYKRIFESEDGKIVLQDLMRSCHVFSSTMDPNPTEHAYKEGERSVVLRIMRTLNIDPSKLEEAMKGQS